MPNMQDETWTRSQRKPHAGSQPLVAPKALQHEYKV